MPIDRAPIANGRHTLLIDRRMNMARWTRRAAQLALGAALAAVAGCVEQTMTINTDPPGALVYLNGQEVGRTPIKRDFEWYGNYDIQVRKDGYDPILTHRWVIAPWYLWAPIDLFAQLSPMHFHDRQKLNFVMTPTTRQAVNPALLKARAEEMRAQLESSPNTPPPTTRAAAIHHATSQPATPATRPAAAPMAQPVPRPTSLPTVRPSPPPR
jgi:hypothetical protein